MNNKQFFIKILAEEETIKRIPNNLGNEYHLMEYTSVSEFLQSLFHDPCNLMIIEVNAESFNGFEVKIKAKSVQSANNLIFLSRKRDISTISKSQRQGADYLFFLPVDATEFKDAISIMFRRRTYWINLMKEVAGGSDEHVG